MRSIQITTISGATAPYTIKVCDFFLENCSLVYIGTPTLPLTINLPSQFDTVPMVKVLIQGANQCVVFENVYCS